jgi:hypothetical protein
MKRVLLVSLVFLFLIGSLNADEGVRDDDSYRIYFHWTNIRTESPGGYGWEDLNNISITAAKLEWGFNVYAKNGQPDYDTGAPVENNSYYPDWYGKKGWDVPDYDCYNLTIDTHAGYWMLCYIEYGQGEFDGKIMRINAPLRGTTKKMSFISEGIIEIELEEYGGNWKVSWGQDTPWEYEDVKLEGKKFIAHIDFNNKEGYLVPKKLLPKKPKKPKK